VDGFGYLRMRPGPVPLVPEVRLYQADPVVGLFADGYHSDRPAPFWAFAWAGGRGLARYLLDHPDLVAGRRVVDLGCGSGLVAIAAALAGAAAVRAVDTDPAAAEAVRRNADANGVTVRAEAVDLLDRPAAELDAEVLLGGDVCYSAAMSARVLACARRAGRAGTTVVVADPDRGFLPARLFEKLGGYEVPTDPPLEGVSVRTVTVWRLTVRSPDPTG
jgi:predicted nicotinamide N-methyase